MTSKLTNATPFVATPLHPRSPVPADIEIAQEAVLKTY